VHTSEEEFEGFRDDAMCCSAMVTKRAFDTCRVCCGDHVMVERRYHCTSKTCSSIGVCSLVWKVFTCTERDTWAIYVNEHDYIRGVVPCTETHPVRITTMMKTSFQNKTISGFHLKKHTSIPVPPRGLPTLVQVRNALKRIRREQGAKNSI